MIPSYSGSSAASTGAITTTQNRTFGLNFGNSGSGLSGGGGGSGLSSPLLIVGVVAVAVLYILARKR